MDRSLLYWQMNLRVRVNFSSTPAPDIRWGFRNLPHPTQLNVNVGSIQNQASIHVFKQIVQQRWLSPTRLKK
jgi:hypothetical protein